MLAKRGEIGIKISASKIFFEQKVSLKRFKYHGWKFMSLKATDNYYLNTELENVKTYNLL